MALRCIVLHCISMHFVVLYLYWFDDVQLRENGGLEPLVMQLHSGNDEVRRNAAWAITVASVDEATATEICKLG
jgi:hypothetical protein